MPGQNIDYLLDEQWWDGGVGTPVPQPAAFSTNPGKSQNIDYLFDEAFFLGAPALAVDEVPGVYQVAIGSHGYVIDPAGYSRVTVPLRRESTDESVEPGEQTLNTGGAWRRSQDNWFLGAGQEYLDNRFAFVSVYTHSGEDPSVRTRFWRSKGVDPWTFGSLSLLPEYTNGAPQLAGTDTQLVAMGDKIYVAASGGLGQFLIAADNQGFDDTIESPDGSIVWPTITSLTTDGYNLYIACGSHGIAMLATGATEATWMRPVAPQPTVTPNGASGSTTYTYYIVAVDAQGFKSLPSSAGITTTGNATLTTGNFNELSWEAVPGAASYDVLAADTGHTIGNTTATTFTDDGTHASVTYTAPTETTDNFQADFVCYANGFLLAAAANELVSVAANGITTFVMAHLNPNFQWTCGAGGPGNIYICGNGGSQGEIYGIQVSTTNFALAAPYTAGAISEGESINAIVAYEGLVILGTSLGVRAASTSSTNGFLTTGPVISDLGACNCLAVYGAFCYFGVNDFAANDGVQTVDSSTTSGLGRLYLSEFSSNLLPAYATDVMSTDTGITNSVALLQGVPWFTVEDSGVWLPTGNVVPQGWLETGWVRYGTVENKILVSMDMAHDPLNGQVQIEVVPFGQPSFLTAPSLEQGSTGPNSKVSAGNLVGEAYMVIPMLTRSEFDKTKGPVLHRWTSRAMIVADRQDQIVVPIIWADEVLSPEGDGTVLPMDLEMEWEYLKGLEAAGTAFVYQEGALSYLAFIDQIEVKPYKWNDQKEMLEGILSVKLLTVN